MGKTRALLTDTDREYIAGEGSDDRRYQAASRVRRRIEEELPQDIAVLDEHHPELLAELRDAVCEEDEDGLLKTLFGETEPEQDFSASDQFKIDLSEEEYEVGYAIPIHHAEIESLVTLLETESEAAFADDEQSFIDQQMQEALRDALPDAKTFRDQVRELRDEIQGVVSHWATQVPRGIGVVYFAIGTRFQLEQYLHCCELRMDTDRDTLAVPEDVFETVQTVLGRIEEAEDADSRLVIISQEQLPPEA